MAIIDKEGEADYLIPGSYYLITLKKTLSKVLKRVIVDCIANTAKKKYPIIIKLNRGKKKTLNSISFYSIYHYY